ncbi:MAG: hypothetical protein DLM57_06745 [Pseudonocardiales bacterium]|nr:MAG: hypothetical protein DLM57_06745 [Pseudonocardiales bacterium]
MSSLIQRTAIVAVVAGLCTLAVGPVAAAENTESTPVMVVLDASGSMSTADAPGPRIDAAKRAVTGLVANLPTEAQVGLEVYGTSTGSSNAEKAAGCKDIKVLVPVGPIDKGAFTAQVARLRASGYTPIGESLRKAAAALPREGPRSIVLVSDGEDTCAPPQPCDVAKELKAQGVDLVVHTVGFKVNAAARAQLVCIADATGGTYVDAPDGPSLGRQLQVRVARALKPYTAVGTPIAGTPSAAGAPELKPGQYLDTYGQGTKGFGGAGTVKYYSVTLHMGETPYLSATLVPPATRVESLTTLNVNVSMTDLDATSGCAFDVVGTDFAYRGRIDASTAVVSPGEVGGPDWPSGCPTDGAFTLKITRAGNSFATQPLKMEVALRIEPSADDSGLPPAAVAQPNARVQAPGPPQNVAAGSSFNDAPVLTPGTYRDTVVSGETRYYKVHLQWGQRLAYVLTPARLPGLGLGNGVIGETQTANPLRARLEQPVGATNSGAFIGSTDIQLYGSTAVPARYTNRRSTGEVKKFAVDGDYYLIFSTGLPTADPLTIPYTLTVGVIGAVERGPVYQRAATPTDSSQQPPSAQTTGAQPSSAASSPVAARGHSSSNVVPTPVLVTAGAGIAACAAGGAALLIRRRRQEASAAMTRPTRTYPPADTW